jgi:DNA-dependent RNA polymerase auxiliary subunit epsilon
MKFIVTVQFERTQSIEVEAETAEEARELVANGEFTEEQIVNTEDDYVDIPSVVQEAKE